MTVYKLYNGDLQRGMSEQSKKVNELYTLALNMYANLRPRPFRSMAWATRLMADFVHICPGQSTTMSISLPSTFDVTGQIRVGSIQLGIEAPKWANSRLGE